MSGDGGVLDEIRGIIDEDAAETARELLDKHRPGVDEDRLRDLIAKWRREAADYPDDYRADAARAALNLCADELEELVEGGR